jgi:hypothetical protein
MLFKFADDMYIEWKDWNELDKWDEKR